MSARTSVDPEAADQPDDGECALCGLPTPTPPVSGDDVAGSFCCRGCMEVARVLDDESIDAGAGSIDADDVRSAIVGDRGPAEPPEDAEEAFVSVEGMHCTTCERFLEGLATSEGGIVDADASYATELVRVAYDPDRIVREEIPDALTGYGYHARQAGRLDEDGEPEDAQVARILAGGGFFGMMVMLYYTLFIYPRYFGYDPLFDLGGYAGLYMFGQIWLFTSAVLFHTGLPVLRGAYVSLRASRPNTDLLVALAATGAYVYSTVAMVLGRTDLYFDVTVAIVLVITAGSYYEKRIRRRATGLLSGLAADRVEEAIRHEDGERIPVEAVEPGERLLVRPGARVPIDGTVDEGVAAVDEALVTGEPIPVEKHPGDEVRGGTVVTDAPLVVRTGDRVESTLDRLVGTLWRIQSTGRGVQRIADRLATVFVPLVLVLAAVVFGGLLLLGASPAEAMLGGLTVVIVACPCALGLATPLAVASGLASAAKRGIVVTGRDVFEKAPDVDVVALDKTGTITGGEMTVEAVYGDGSVLDLAAAVEAYSPHPIGEAIAEAASPEEDVDVDGFERLRRGVAGDVGDRRVLVGHPELFEPRRWELSDDHAERATAVQEDGAVPAVVGWEGRSRGVIAVGDSPRDAWDDVVDRLSTDHEVVVITGDDGPDAERFRDHPGVDEVFAGVPPEGKAETIRRLRGRGTVAMVGDGSNDAPALAAADLGIAMGGGTSLASEAADVVIVDDDLRSVPLVFDLVARTRRRTRENLAWAFAYNAVALPAAILGLLNPLLAAAAMATSSALVVTNSARSLGVND